MASDRMQRPPKASNLLGEEPRGGCVPGFVGGEQAGHRASDLGASPPLARPERRDDGIGDRGQRFSYDPRHTLPKR